MGNASSRNSNTRVCSPSINSIVKSIKLSLSENRDHTQQIDVLINFMDDVLSRIKAPPEAASTSTSSSSRVSFESVASCTKAAAQIIDFVSSQADKLKNTEIKPKEMRSVAMSVLSNISDTHWVFLGLSLVAYALQRWATSNSNVSECTEILEKLIDLAKDLKKFREAVPEESQKVPKAICVIVEGTFICFDYIQKGEASRLAHFQPINLSFQVS